MTPSAASPCGKTTSMRRSPAIPILVTALNPIIGYQKAAEIAKRAYKEGRAVIDVAVEMTDLDRKDLARLLDPQKLTQGGIQE